MFIAQSRYLQTRNDKKVKRNWYVFKTKNVNYYMEDKTLSFFMYYEIKLNSDYKTCLYNCTGWFKDKDNKLCEKIELSKLGANLVLEREDLHDDYIQAIKRYCDDVEFNENNFYDRAVREFIARNNGKKADWKAIEPLELIVKNEVDEYLEKGK